MTGAARLSGRVVKWSFTSGVFLSVLGDGYVDVTLATHPDLVAARGVGGVGWCLHGWLYGAADPCEDDG